MPDKEAFESRKVLWYYYPMSQIFAEFVQTSALSSEDKSLWMGILATLTEGQIEIFKEFAERKEENLKTLTENIKAKRRAFESRDKKALKEIVISEQ